MTPWPGEIRLARDDDGPAIGKLFAEAQYPDHGVDWYVPGIGKWWFVAEQDERIVGAINFAASQPYAWIGEIVIHPNSRGLRSDGHSSLGGKSPGFIARQLYYSVFHACRELGCELIRGCASRAASKAYLKHHGGTQFGETFSLFALRLR